MSKPQPLKQPHGGASHAGTPIPSQPLLSCSKFGTLLHSHSKPVKLAHEVHQWLEAKGWILTTEPYNCMKLACTLMTAVVTSNGPKLKDNVNNKPSDILADTVTSKVLEHIKPIVHCIMSSLNFASANDMAQAETTLALKSVSAQLEMVSTSLNNVITKLMPALPLYHPCPSLQPLSPHPRLM
ncbi:hypothetical protein H2248_001985 [Termitomyces sp. 'cryptogamus']|nr:hypothetical protein H2248_001985 [Termitomyces sp. 'cryptogamus']